MENKIKKFITVERLLLFAMGIFLIIYFKGIFFQTKQTIVQVEKAKQELIKDENGNNHFRKTFQNNTSEIAKNEIDSLKKIIQGKNAEVELKNVEILAVTKLNASIKNTLKIFKIEKDALNFKVWKFEKDYEDGTKSRITMFEKDSSAIQETDLKLAITDFSAKEKGKKQYYVDVTSQNKGFKLNGSEVLRIPVKEPKDFLNLNLSSAYYGGLGNQNNFGTTELKLWLLPDNAIVPNIGTGLIWFINEGKIFPYYKVGVDIKLKSVRR